MERKVFIGKSLYARIIGGEPTSDITVIDLPEGVFILDRTEGCIEICT